MNPWINDTFESLLEKINTIDILAQFTRISRRVQYAFEHDRINDVEHAVLISRIMDLYYENGGT